jgi:PAS domain S-box-containing protein
MSEATRILIVDDDQRMCDSLRRLLNASGYEVLAVSRGTRALELLRRQEVDLVLLDLLMPDMDGHRVMDHLNEHHNEIPVVVMTGHASIDSAVGSLRRGAYDYLRKPFEFEELANTISNALDQKRLRRENEWINDRLERIEERYRYLVDNSPDIVYTLDPEGYFSFINHAVESMLGFRAKELIGRHYSVIVYEDEIDKAEHHFNERRAGERSALGAEIRLRSDPAFGGPERLESPYLIAELKASGIYDAQGDYLGTYGVIRDISARKRTEKKLRESEQRYRALVEAAPDIIYSLSIEDGSITSLNPAFEKIMGWSSDDWLGKPLTDLIHPQDAPQAVDKFRQVLNGEITPPFELRLRTKSEVEMIGEFIAAPEIKNGKVEKVVGFVRDVTDRKRMEEELLKGQKLESIGILAGGIAHDFNNILAAIVGNLSLGKLYVQATDKVFELLDDAEKAAFRAKDLTARLITFAQGGGPIKKKISLGDLVRSACEAAVRGSAVRCEIDLPDDLWEVEVDEGQMVQVFNNIFLNAEQAMPDGGTILVKAENLIAGDGLGLPLQTGPYVKVSIEDQGPGIAPENLPRIFDPFFTTRSNASGLGLASSYSIIKRHGGYITAESQAGRGAAFRVFLPASGVPGVQSSKTVEGRTGSRSRILVMDDEDMVRKVVVQMLSHLGYAVDVASDGREAVEKYEEGLALHRPFDLVILDLTVPGGIGGKEAVSRLREIDPGVKALVASGYSDDPVVTRFWEHGFQGVIAKPFRIDELHELLNQVLGNETGRPSS